MNHETYVTLYGVKSDGRDFSLSGKFVSRSNVTIQNGAVEIRKASDRFEGFNVIPRVRPISSKTGNHRCRYLRVMIARKAARASPPIKTSSGTGRRGARADVVREK